MTRRELCCFVLIMASIGAWFVTIDATAQIVQPATALGPGSQYLSFRALPGLAQTSLAVLGNRLWSPGKERMTLTGSYTIVGGSGTATLIWEVPGRLIFRRSEQSGKPLIVNPGKAVSCTEAADSADCNILETLFDDSAESFLYGFRGALRQRLLGTRFRTDNGHTPNYNGPWYDVFAVSGRVYAQPGNTTRLKHFYIDSQTHLLARIRYIENNLDVSTEITWMNAGGQMCPARIMRVEGGKTVFQFTSNAAAFGPSANDGTFPQ